MKGDGRGQEVKGNDRSLFHYEYYTPDCSKSCPSHLAVYFEEKKNDVFSFKLKQKNLVQFFNTGYNEGCYQKVGTIKFAKIFKFNYSKSLKISLTLQRTTLFTYFNVLSQNAHLRRSKIDTSRIPQGFKRYFTGPCKKKKKKSPSRARIRVKESDEACAFVTHEGLRMFARRNKTRYIEPLIIVYELLF